MNDEITNLPNLLTYREAGILLGLKDKQCRAVARLVAKGKLISVNLGLGQQSKRIAPYDLAKFIEEHRDLSKRRRR